MRKKKEWLPTYQMAASGLFKEALNDMVKQYAIDKKIEINNIIAGYSDDWKISHWEEWKVIREKYYKAKERFFERFKPYMKLCLYLYSRETKDMETMELDDITENMVEVYTKRRILLNNVEKARFPLHPGQKGWKRASLSK